jgi:hypothetical protein
MQILFKPPPAPEIGTAAAQGNGKFSGIFKAAGKAMSYGSSFFQPSEPPAQPSLSRRGIGMLLSMAEPLLSPVQGYLAKANELMGQERVKIRIDEDGASQAARARAKRWQGKQEVEHLDGLGSRLQAILDVLTVPDQQEASTIDVESLLQQRNTLQPAVDSLTSVLSKILSIITDVQNTIRDDPEQAETLQPRLDQLKAVAFAFQGIVNVLEVAKTDRQALLDMTAQRDALKNREEGLKHEAKIRSIQASQLHATNVQLRSALADSKADTAYTQGLLQDEMEKRQALEKELDDLKKELERLQRDHAQMQRRDEQVFGGGYDVSNIF